MKKLAISLFAILFCMSLIGFRIETENPKKIQWMTLEEAQEACKKEPRKILIDIYTTWCGPCKMMSEFTFKHPVIIDDIEENFYAVKFDAESTDTVKFHNMLFINRVHDAVNGEKTRGQIHDLVKYLEITGYPTLVFLDEETNVLQPIKGFLNPRDLEPMLQFIGTNQYKITDWESYIETFETAIASPSKVEEAQ